MAINTTRLATSLGHIIASLNEVNTYRGTTLAARVGTIFGDHTSVNPDLVSDLYSQQTTAEGSFLGWLSYLSQLASDTIIAEVTNDKKLPNPGLVNCLTEWRRQMLVAGDSFNQSLVTIGSLTAIGSPTSNVQFVATDKDGSGVRQDLVVPDSYLITVSQDDQRGASTYSEQLSIVGKEQDANATDSDYPTGAGIDTVVTITDPALAVGVVSNGGFDTWTVSNTPDGWTIALGAAGTNVFRVADDPRDGAAGFSARLLTTTGVLTVALRQTVSLEPNTLYGVHFKYKPVSDGSATASTITAAVRLYDPDADATITDDASTANSQSSSTHAVVTAGSGWNHGYQAIFITPTTLPDTVQVEVALTAGDVDAEGYVDHVQLVPLTPLYIGGPTFAFFSGKVRAALDDAWTLAITLASGTISGYIVRGLDRLLNMKSLGVRIPTSGSPTQSDGLIV